MVVAIALASQKPVLHQALEDPSYCANPAIHGGGYSLAKKTGVFMASGRVWYGPVSV